MVSFSNELLDDAERIARMMTNFELSESPSFMDNYTAALFLPHTHADAFPEVTERLGLSEDNACAREPAK